MTTDTDLADDPNDPRHALLRFLKLEEVELRQQLHATHDPAVYNALARDLDRCRTQHRELYGELRIEQVRAALRRRDAS